jgi:hypothetical protein
VDVVEALLEAARAEARQTGCSEAEVVEDVLSKHFESRPSQRRGRSLGAQTPMKS